MGVRNLWAIIESYGHKISVVELQKKQVAVDLSCWICENKLLNEYNRLYTPNLHLRNIFFKTSALLLADVLPVFVMDGDAPEIKLSTLKRRNQAWLCKRNPDRQKEDPERKPKTDRKILKYTLKECQGLLKFLGLECLWSCSEGEALCALLDEKGIVDGVITEDSDAFLYGARKVYKNFKVNAGWATVDVFKMSDIEEHLNLTKEKLIAMGLLCGCDYNSTGVHGIGTAKSLKYLSSFDGDIFSRLKQLKNDKELINYDAVKNGCKRCHHPGKRSIHVKLGCTVCGTESTCKENNICQFDALSDNEKMRLDFELCVRQKTMSDSQFPDMNTVNEYLNFPQKIPDVKGKWMKPDVMSFVLFMERKCNWSQCYAFRKIAPLCCRWSLLNGTFNDFIPFKLLKKRVVKGVPSFDVEWKIKINVYNLCKDHTNCIDEVITTSEPEVLLMEKCKNLYEVYVSERCEKSKKGKKLKKKTCKEEDVDDLTGAISRLSVGNEITMSVKLKPASNLLAKNDETENMIMSSFVCDINESSELGESALGLDLNDTDTLDYDLSDYTLNESSILNSIIDRRQYY